MMWELVYAHLKANGIDVYSMGQKTTPDTLPHVIVKQGASSAYVGSNHTGYSLLTLVIYYPADKYSQMFDYLSRVKQLMIGLNNTTGNASNALRFTGNETPHIIDDVNKMYTTMIDYQIMKKL